MLLLGPKLGKNYHQILSSTLQLISFLHFQSSSHEISIKLQKGETLWC
jgi:hypothetical protein